MLKVDMQKIRLIDDTVREYAAFAQQAEERSLFALPHLVL
jgi:hypothetical protein